MLRSQYDVTISVYPPLPHDVEHGDRLELLHLDDRTMVMPAPGETLIRITEQVQDLIDTHPERVVVFQLLEPDTPHPAADPKVLPPNGDVPADVQEQRQATLRTLGIADVPSR